MVGEHTIDSHSPFLNSNKNILGWVRGVTKEPELEWGKTPLLDWLSAHGRWDMDEVHGVRFVVVAYKKVSPRDPRTPVSRFLF